LRELFKTIEDSAFGQAKISIFFQAARTFKFIEFCLKKLLSRLTSKAKPKSRSPEGCSAKYQRATGKMPAPLRRAEAWLLGLAMVVFSLGVPYSGSGADNTTSYANLT
jgi:hypothetical protein